MKKINFASERGYSLIETMIVLVVTGILVTFAVGRFGNAGTNFQRQNISRELKVNLERARFDSVKRRAEGGERAEVTLLNDSSFRVKTDMNQNGALDAAEVRTIDFGGRSDVKIVGDALVFAPVSIKFDRYGRIEAKNARGDDVTPLFTVCTDGCTAADADAATADVIYVSPSGTVAMLKGGEEKPSFTAPTITNGDLQINKEVQVYSATSSNSSP